MAYLVNSARPAALTIGSTNYLPNLISFQVADTSGFRNGLITTSGSITLGSLPGQSLADYKRDDFKRGRQVVFEVTYPSGTTARHPRGLLYVISSSYSPEEEQINIEVACSLSMSKLLDKDEEIEQLIEDYKEIPLDPAAEAFENLAASIAAATKVMWQDSDGNYQKEKFFGSDNFGQYEPGSFVSVRGQTALSVQPLAATAAIPDELELSYQYPSDLAAQDNQGRVDTVTTESNYFLRYPANTYKREAPDGPLRGNISLPIPPVTIPATKTTTSGCGNTPSRPSYSPATKTGGGSVNGSFDITVPSSCSEGWSTVSNTVYVPAKRTEVRTTYYAGPGGQTSMTEQEVWGPAIEANNQYFADKFQYCVATYANQCLPMGGCGLDGTEQMKLGRSNTTYFYGSANEVVKTVSSTYRPTLSAAQPTDWRSGINRGIPQNFNQNLSRTTEYLHQVVIREFERSNNENVQKTTTYTSVASRGGGIGAALNAYAGIKTSEIRRSVTTVTNDLRPDSVNAATTQVDTDTTKVQMHGKIGGYVGDDGPYIVKEDVPTPLLLNTKAEVESAVNVYGDYLARYIEGDARGLVVAEGLREAIASSWKPNMPFRYYDPFADELMAFRADACTWGADSNGCVVVMNGIWVADLIGSVTLGDNVQGNATPDMSGSNDPTPPTHGVTDPVTDPGEKVTGKRFNFYVTVPLSFGVTTQAAGNDGVRPIPFERDDVTLNWTFVMWCTGRIVQPGAMVSLDLNGSIPVDFVGQPIVDDTLIVDEDLFD